MFNKYILEENSNNVIVWIDLYDCLVFLNCVVFEKCECKYRIIVYLWIKYFFLIGEILFLDSFIILW